MELISLNLSILRVQAAVALGVDPATAKAAAAEQVLKNLAREQPGINKNVFHSQKRFSF